MRTAIALSALGAAASRGVTRPAAGGPVPYTCAGALDVAVNGAVETWCVVTASSSWEHVAANGTAVSVAYNDRAYLVSDCDASGGVFSADLYAKRLPMLGFAWAFTVDLSTVGCGCNSAFYAVAMPGVAAGGEPASGTAGDFYCDANNVTGTWCTEVDLMEANTAALAATPHACDAPDAAGFVPKCDRGGCSLNTKNNASLLGPGPGFTVDTRRPFRVTTSFPVDARGKLAAVDTLVQQGAASFHLVHTAGSCGSAWTDALSAGIVGGMVPTFSLWGGTASGSDMTWLDVPPCDPARGCGGDGVVALFSGLAVTSL